jgi:hypothetical protein
VQGLTEGLDGDLDCDGDVAHGARAGPPPG